MPDRSKFTQDDAPVEDVAVEPEPVAGAVVGGNTEQAEANETDDQPEHVEYTHDDIKVKLNPDKGLDSPSFVSVPNFDEIELSDTAKSVEYFHAQLLLSTDAVVAE